MIFNLTTPAVSKLPKFTYTGTYSLIDDGNGNWRIVHGYQICRKWWWRWLYQNPHSASADGGHGV